MCDRTSRVFVDQQHRVGSFRKCNGFRFATTQAIFYVDSGFGFVRLGNLDPAMAQCILNCAGTVAARVADAFLKHKAWNQRF